MALACAYSSSAEFEAAVIRARRNAGIYAAKRRQRVLAIAVLLSLALVMAFATAG
jgi:hypothetical protein